MEMANVKVGMRFRLHPGTDLFMMGFRYATVTKVGRKWVHADAERLDITRKIKLSPDNMMPMEEH